MQKQKKEKKYGFDGKICESWVIPQLQLWLKVTTKNPILFETSDGFS